ncbi:hypothetical protein R1T08_17310 [Streptomyces sp. SBC-4]|nr:hypothetical protein [Streptomyces sp. SBC-4]MDV5145920.1 hypothetical protein [Streptomyces sp. SBC-4]
MDRVTFTVRAVVAGQPCEVTMHQPRSTWDDVNAHERNEILETCRIRFANWARKEYGVSLTEEERAAVHLSID